MRNFGTVLPPETAQRPKGPGDGTDYDDDAHIVVLNDNHNTFEHVAASLASVLPGVDYAKGMGFANKIHKEGRARVWSGHREIAELYWEQLHAAGLTLVPLGDR